MNFREHLLKLDPMLILEGAEMDSTALYLEIKNILDVMSEDEIDEFGSFLAVEFFEEPVDEIEDVYFDIDNVLEMIDELGDEAYAFILDLLLPEDFTSSENLEHLETDNYEEVDIHGTEDDEDVNEGVGRVMKVKNLNKKKRKFFAKSAAVLRKERAKRVKKNRITRATRKAYQRVNKVKLKAYMKSRDTFMKKGRHFTKIRRQAGE